MRISVLLEDLTAVVIVAAVWTLLMVGAKEALWMVIFWGAFLLVSELVAYFLERDKNGRRS